MSKKFTKFISTEKKLRNKIFSSFAAASSYVLTSSSAFAAPTPQDVDPVDKAMNFICNWGWKLGIVMAFWGAVQFAIAFKNDDSNGKTNGLKFLVSGAMVAGLCFAGYKTIFGIA